MSIVAIGWSLAGFALYLTGAAICALSAIWLARKGDRFRSERGATIVALSLTAAWCVSVAALGLVSPIVMVAEVARNLAWIYVLYRLFAIDGRHESLAPIRPVAIALGFVEGLQLALFTIGSRFAITPELAWLVFQVSAMFHVLVAIGSLVLLHNLYAGAVPATRQALRWSAAALAGLWAFDLNLYTVAYLGGGIPVELAALRGIVTSLMAVPLLVGFSSASAALRLRPSRTLAFQSFSLIILGGYLLLMVGIAQSLSMLGDDLGRLTQVSFVFAASVVALFWLPSNRLRGWLRVTVVKHLFQYRYDYRAEWLRFTQTIGSAGEADDTLAERLVKAMADITDSPSGLLLQPEEDGGFSLAARWRWKSLAVPADSIPAELAALLQRKGFVLNFDEIRLGHDRWGEAELVPSWLLEDRNCWALVPLLHFDHLTGIIVLARPAIARDLDWEDYDLLRVVGRQLASYLAEKAGQEALMEAARFDEFSRRIAFVMHDIKNLASQLSLLARNAEKHADKPEFRADMLVTLRNSADKLNALLSRLGRYGSSGAEARSSLRLVDLATRVARHFETAHKVEIIAGADPMVLAAPEGLEQALAHLVQNAVDASEDAMPVYLDISSDGMRGKIEVVDSGRGMSPEFVRTGLFKPFVSSKTAGFGIGAFEARELIRSMGGRLEVESREGLGTRFAASLPLADTATLIEHHDNFETEVA